MTPYFKISFILLLFYAPFLFLIFIPSKTLLHSNDFLYDVCQPLKAYHIKPFEQLFCQKEQTIAIIKPDGYAYSKDIKSILIENGFHILESKSTQQWYHDKVNQSYFPSLQRYLTSGPIEALLLERIDAIRGLRRLIGPTDPEKAREFYPSSIRAHYGTNIQENAVHASDSVQAVLNEKKLLLEN
ncbi:unnamed protein product [Cunninghamella echinulata]